jgi:hypothetical protein
MSAVDMQSASPAPGPLAVPSRWSRWSDRLNPILVREVQQSLRGRMFVVSVLLALLLSIVIAIEVAGSHDRGPNRAGRAAFQAGLATLAPLVLFVVPMQAFGSMRLELRSGIVEQLLLSELRPWRILAGKLQAAMVQFTLFLAVLSPLLATSYLLRGVDLPTIVVSLLLALLCCAVATMFAVSSATQARIPALQTMANLGTAFGLGITAFAGVGLCMSGELSQGIGELLRSGVILETGAALVLLAAVASVLMALVAQSSLLHAFENKSTGFRVMLFVVPAITLAWLWLCFSGRARSEGFAVVCFLALLYGIVVGVFMVTEQRELSPRVRAHVPRSPLLALLAAPFLPGRDRGLLCFLLFVGVLAGTVALAWPAPTGTMFDVAASLWRLGALTIAYGVVYLWLGHALRGRLPATVQASQAARVMLPLMLLLFVVLPILIDVLLLGGVRGWHPLHVMDPFWTIDHFVGPGADRMQVGLVATAALVVAVVVSFPAIVRGVNEVLAASAARRAAAPQSNAASGTDAAAGTADG